LERVGAGSFTMTPTRQGSFHLFRFAGVDVYLHWSWFVIALFQITDRKNVYSSISWNALEYVALFVIVLMHEFGHALACRQVGGQANQIVLWPLGGVAYVAPPLRPGATLWSIAAGPLVNVVLFPVLTVLWMLSRSWGWENSMPDKYLFLYTIWMINCGLLIFNLLPIYPLDGGQILRSLLWFAFGRARSLMIATIIGFVGVAALIGLAFKAESIWMGVLSAFILMNCWKGLQQARALSRLEKLPRHGGFACPDCKIAPPIGAFWMCPQCRKPFDMFSHDAVCPDCRALFSATACLDCGSLSPMREWSGPAPVAPIPPKW
jgi:Zn-dependent protease